MDSLTVAAQNLAGAGAGTAEARADAATFGITAGTMVLTLDGDMPVQFLSPGDRVITRSGARTLRSVDVTVLTDAPMIRISASALGHDRPAEDLFVAEGQPVLIRDWRARALYGAPHAVVPAARLADGEYIRRETVAEVRLFTLRFDAEVVIYAGGLELGCSPAPAEAAARAAA